MGYSPKDTLGRKIIEKSEVVNIFGRPYQVGAEIFVVNAFSAHADKNDLFDFVKEVRENVKKVFIVHGEYEQSDDLRRRLKSLNVNAVVPRKNEIAYLAAA